MRYFVHPLLLQRQLIVFVILELHLYFCDITSPEHINIDPKDIERRITPKTKGILVVHMAGFPAKMDEIMTIARVHNLKVIEDACHGPLSEYKGKKVGYDWRLCSF
ncbi:DegT/DnrJ/EryC1/StrS family aminotransferase [Bacteroides ovatus]|nr:DegT/DnrJ/EryC1/StrS family aminotransferase [Bacteroides ovatus]